MLEAMADTGRGDASSGFFWGALAQLVPAPLRALDAEIADRLAKAPLRLNRYGYDPFGLHPDSARRLILPAALLYRHYFRVETHDIERVPGGRAILVANHSGQFGYDSAMLGVALLLEAEPPRLVRGMAEYLFFRLPFAGTSVVRVGGMVGTPENCIHMLEQDECVMVFPEGARGANKPFRKRYQLQQFGTGFMRLALETGAPIVPVGIVGAEEQQPGLANLEDLGRRLHLPSFPITISQPWFGLPGAAFALPTKYRLWFGEPMHFEGDARDEDAAIERRVGEVKAALRSLLARGLAERRHVFY
jgi:1-acyl-sn-glycerol-3-phosphate acyltransferase